MADPGMHDKEELLISYQQKSKKIRERLAEFEEIGKKGNDVKLFSELCFCICVPQSKARFCDAAIKELVSKRGLFQGTFSDIAKVLKRHGVRFPGNKAGYIAEARYHLMRDGLGMRQLLERYKGDDEAFRKWLVSNIKGLGMKESSHFLRNIGRGKEMAILDRHILKNLKEHGVINEVPSLSEKNYLEIERKMKAFAAETKIPLAELDLLFWSHETGVIFK